MDGVVQLGPVAMATDRLIAVAAIWAFVAIAGVVAMRFDKRAARVGWVSLLLGLAAARAGFVLANLDAFMVDPWSMLALWQGGFSVWPGIVATALTILVMLGRAPAGLALIGGLAGLMLLHAGAAHLLAPVPRAMPQIALTNLKGTQTVLGAPGRPMVINLWATWCPPCRREMPMLIDVAKNSKLPILLVNQGENPMSIRAFLLQQGLAEDAILTDPGNRLGQAIASPALPTTLFVDGAGQIVDRHAGEISRAALMAAIRNLQRNPVR